ncbi:Pet127-domain-containing protein [Suhomyces tanzawaensis NRRL Y-17324]|uniref:Pet127-domain-containing protein n=1 Tax=Suhomyces tanzawaensis NRRL Y-17324 TaxID=984487 RepID=A0A1E4SPB7_9ASCO|nr:Pet127-domain-containing protein [Suhomyces tanzawaensis NRRL Y-17324]ODV81345.1 Pet127-domain-containing protein [Suhomyces tanzawaensis NRRL Y-17324]
MFVLTYGWSRQFFWRTTSFVTHRLKSSSTNADAIVPKRKYIKKQKPIDLTGALKGTFRIVPNDKEIKSFGSEDDGTSIPTSRPSKVDKRYVKELDNNVLSKGVRRAINLSNQEKKKDLIHDDDEKDTSPSGSKGPVPVIPDVNRVSRHVKSPASKPRIPSPKVIFENKNSHCVLLGKTDLDIRLQQAEKLDHKNIPKLAHNLDKSLFSPGVHFLQDPRTRVYNFPPFLKKIIKYKDFNFNAISTFQRVSKDQTLLKMAEKHKKKYYSSTSSMTATFIQFYLLLNNYDPLKTSRFNFTPFSGLVNSLPSSSIIQPRTNASGKIYSIESDKSNDNEILLSAMGHCLETLLTTEEKEFERFNKNSSDPVSAQEQLENVYNYAGIGKFLLRSQLDCYDSRLPGNGTFDLKTRAACSIRYDSSNPDIEENNYQIWRLNGEYESFEKEYRDLVRTGALLKYSFQARIGQMDGIYVAYHNINSFFGFQYFPLQQLDEVFYNHEGVEKYKHRIPENLLELDPEAIDLSHLNDGLPTYVAERQFAMSMHIYQDLLDTIVQGLPDTGFRMVMKSTPISRNAATRLYVYAVPVTDSDIKNLQSFPDSFRTSFKENILAGERAQNLQAHCDRLKRFNEQTTAKKTVHSYYVDIDGHTIDGKAVTTRCPYPQRVGAEWTVNYTIHKMDNSNEKVQARSRKEYVDMLATAAETITIGTSKRDQTKGELREDVVRTYSKIGQARARAWAEKDAEAVVYTHSDKVT